MVCYRAKSSIFLTAIYSFLMFSRIQGGREGTVNVNINSKYLHFVFSGCIHERTGKPCALPWYTQRYITPRDVWEHSYNTTDLYLLVSSSSQSASEKNCRKRLSSMPSSAAICAGCTPAVAGAHKFLSRGSTDFWKLLNAAGAKHKGKPCCRLKVKMVSVYAKYLGN